MSKADEILDSAESMIRDQGYNGFSFRDIANAVGVKSASVHYHFPTKANLGAAVAKRYTDRFLSLMPDLNSEKTCSADALKTYISAFRSALINDGKMCLCGILGAEKSALPDEVGEQTERFFDENCRWLEKLYLRANKTDIKMQPRTWALRTLATLEGAMIVSRNMKEPDCFDQITQGLGF